MAILKVTQMGHPILRKIARQVSVKEIKSAAMKKLISDMWETLEEYEGVGLAAPQVFKSINLAIVGSKKNRYTAGAIKPRVIFNASYRGLSELDSGVYEGCLSIPGIRAYVPRFSKIEVNYMDMAGKKQKKIIKGFEAIVFQHEIDHLHGILYLDKCVDKTLTFEREYERYHQ